MKIFSEVPSFVSQENEKIYIDPGVIVGYKIKLNTIKDDEKEELKKTLSEL